MSNNVLLRGRCREGRRGESDHDGSCTCRGAHGSCCCCSPCIAVGGSVTLFARTGQEGGGAGSDIIMPARILMQLLLQATGDNSA
eukprot:352361-Chlamydomonas_euryale.AAC.4